MASLTFNQSNNKPKTPLNYSQLWGMEEGERGSVQDYIQRNPDDFFVRLQRVLEEDKKEEPQTEIPPVFVESKFSATGEMIFPKSEIQIESVEKTKAGIPQSSQESLNQILNSTSEYTIKATENVLAFTEGMVLESGGAFADLFNMVTGREKGQGKGKEKPGENKKGSEKLKPEQFNLRAQSWNQELQAAQARESQIIEAKEEARSGIIGSTEQLAKAAGLQSGYEKVKNVYTRSFIAVKNSNTGGAGVG
ncbi:MAG: hypothetical protein UU29_C0001G0015 [Candidatus Daviesbacteria bacterium GW2011_GWA2_40_9]|uniref:Uncharacterized protein n=1 Tax=Candidatus Daviesbacteria bacterium GW2011_GWA2_40_9 TaxID=1618424 RepID=A0A0G0WHI2_9BACT|nr:MAG: hypothetical protein UU29_C0001G0015 [Candidatus Daviesbacteria bacterium GW2011_GWA2_40_9]